jgi:tetratricopeptide (TPR) repeat protein
MSRDIQPPLAELLSRYIRQQTAAHADGMALPESLGEVVPHDAAPAQPVDPRTAWNEATTALRCFGEAKGLDTPPDWPTLVVGHEPESAPAFAAGNFPQLVRNLLPLYQTKDLSALRPRGTHAAQAPALVEWAGSVVQKKQPAQILLALGALRLAGNFDAADALMKTVEAATLPAWRGALANEKAALAWHRGRAEEAAAAWQSQPDSVPALFNRGMAALFMGRRSDARAALDAAVSQLPDDSAWHHLGRLYLALAEMG